MTTSPRSPARSLRIGVVLSGQLVEERLFDGATPITLGRSLRAALSIPYDELPHEHVLAVRDGAGFTLMPPSGMTVDGNAARGRLQLGELTILVQEVVPPAPVPRPQLPRSLEWRLTDRIDRRLAAIIGGSLALHLGIAIAASFEDAEDPLVDPPHVAMRDYEVLTITLPDSLVDSPPVSTQGASTPVAPARQTPRRIVEPTRITATQPQPIDSQKLAAILTGADGEQGKAAMSPRAPGAELGKQIAHAQDMQAEIGDTSRTSRVDDRVHIDTDPRPPIVDDPTLTHVPSTRRDEPKIRVIPGGVVDEDTTTLTPQAVLDRINTVYMAGLQRCYRFGLVEDAQLSGRVAIRLTVDARGKVIDPDASGVSSTVDSCISKQMGSWRFPVPKDKENKPTDATFRVSLALQPS